MARNDRAAAAAVAIVAGAVYLATIFPGLAAIGDTPKFQFVGPVLGTPHSPGYPLYMVLSWLFAQIPVGSIAFRVNLLSAVAGAVAVAILFLVLRELGCRRAIAAGGALAIGFGHVFWSQAILAEVYTLNAAIFTAALLFLLRWARTRRDRDLIGAVAMVGLGATHHLTLVMTVPALTAYALLVDWRRATAARIIGWTCVLAALSTSAYAYIWIRTIAQAPFLEVQARSIAELARIIRADTFDGFLGQLTVRDIVRERVPLIVEWLVTELRPAGLALAAVGAVAVAARQWREAVLLAGIGAIIIAFALDYVVYDVEVFLLLALIALGLLAARGLEAIAATLVDRLTLRPVAIVATGALAVAPCSGQFFSNRTTNDQHRHVYENELMDALFKALPDRSAIVRESYPIDHMVLYKLLAEHAAQGRTIVMIPSDPAAVAQALNDGFRVYAFHEHRLDLAAKGVEFVDAPLGLPTARSMTHVLDTEALTIGYPMGEVVRIGEPEEMDTSTAGRFNPAVKSRR